MGMTYSEGKDDQFKDSDSEDKSESPDLWVEEWGDSGKEQVAQPG